MSKNQRAPFLVFCMVAILCGFVMVATARGEVPSVPGVTQAEQSVDGREQDSADAALRAGSRLLESLGLGTAPGAPAQADEGDALDAAVGATEGSATAAGSIPLTAASADAPAPSDDRPSTVDGTAGRGAADSGSGVGRPGATGSTDDTAVDTASGTGTGPGPGTGGGSEEPATEDDDPSEDPGTTPAPGADPGPVTAPAAPWTPPVKGGAPTFGEGSGVDGSDDGGTPAPPPDPTVPTVPTLPTVPPAPPIVCEPRIQEQGANAAPTEPVEPAAPVEPAPVEPTAPVESAAVGPTA